MSPAGIALIQLGMSASDQKPTCALLTLTSARDQKRKCAAQSGMSAMGHKQTFRFQS